jgi:hypothetical protein
LLTLQEMLESSAGGEASNAGKDGDGEDGDGEDGDNEVAAH